MYTPTQWQNGVTPINETNLNKIENAIDDIDANGTIVSTTTPTDTKKVWIQYSKNKFDKSKYIQNISAGTSVSDITFRLEPSTAYTMSSNIPQSSGNALFFIKSGTTTSGASTSANGVWNGQSRTVTTDSNGYLSIAYRKLSGDTINLTTYWYQLEKGSTATTNVDYVEPSINIKNDNNVYDKLNTPQITQLLSSTAITQGSEYTLNDNVTNYKYIMVELATASADQNGNRQYIPVSLIKTYTADTRVAISLFQSTTVYLFGDFYFSASNKIYCYTYTHAMWNAQLKVYGIN